MVVERVVETGIEIIEVELPALITVLKDINIPRLPSFRLKKKAKVMPIPEWGSNGAWPQRGRSGSDRFPNYGDEDLCPGDQVQLRDA